MRSGADRLLAQVVQMLGAAQPHHAWLFTNRRGNRLKVLLRWSGHLAGTASSASGAVSLANR